MGAAIVADPALLDRSVVFDLPASANLAAALNGDGSPEMETLAQQLQAEGQLGSLLEELRTYRAADPGYKGSTLGVDAVLGAGFLPLHFHVLLRAVSRVELHLAHLLEVQRHPLRQLQLAQRG